ncbi:hypothetical protein LU604_26110 (plasmid) [Erwinia tracheiphila]|uniref:Uncharacterized protein n=1 Tax=Erwinia tracheiphila TaxID=65700 RepID=A0A345CZW0_9GAMM|nr:hypothetical protein [Erwinia tracheiphila]AXF78977.1 hypothetical protein AV903_26320 [Erwinia tracheiphila]UIA85878.1 hypothetical protein LU604_26110 [Erwinia tracheiphila]UIA94399.1 hypothetical protein LU632_25585 [Erwinia tracheiphila]
MKKKKLPESGLLTSDRDWHNNACLNYMSDHGTAYTEGYRLAADILIRHIDETARDQDLLVYPVVFLYRHHIELQIKQVTELARRVLRENDPRGSVRGTHNLNTLWADARGLLLQADDTLASSNFTLVSTVVKALNEVDLRATGFRYARTSEGGRSLEGLHYINTRRFGEQMAEASDVLDGIDKGLRYLLFLDSEMHGYEDGFS